MAIIKCDICGNEQSSSSSRCSCCGFPLRVETKPAKERVRIYQEAAEQGYANAQYNLGICYANGRGVPKNYEEAAKWYRLSAEQGYINAQYNLGVMYDNGQGVEQSYSKAVEWYRKAAEQVILAFRMKTDEE